MLVNLSSRPARARPAVRRYRTVFISDLYLGTPGCKADCLMDFLHHVESEYLYLVGDVVDGWQLKKRWFCPSDMVRYCGVCWPARAGAPA